MLTDMNTQGLEYAVIATVILIVLFAILRLFFKELTKKAMTALAASDWVIKVQQLELLSVKEFRRGTRWVIHICHILAVLILIYLYIPLVLRLFPWTEPLAQPFIEYFTQPLFQVWEAIINYIPSLLQILVIIFYAWLILKFLWGAFAALRAGYIVLPGFHDEWAEPTYKIFRIIIFFLTLVMIFPFMPGADSPAFKGMSLVVGAMVTLGSSGAMTNITAGIVLLYTRSFKKGDYVKIGETFGQVIERTLIATRLQTTKNENVTIPNSTVLSSLMVNYSDTSDSPDLVMHTAIGLGYDLDWRKAHELLKNAALKTQYIESYPEPFVLQKSLDDFSVSYEINAHTKRPDLLPAIYSELNRNILDEFSREHIEIMSPHY
ncbi:MAG: mechanosensitive ion channel, partial [Methyloprofundus sp.]|nr:mechanosensitive ion channel [Methyloprofundus sp.]